MLQRKRESKFNVNIFREHKTVKSFESIANKSIEFHIAKLSSSWLVQPSSAELRFALILVITPTHHPPTRESSFEPLLDCLGGCNLVWKLNSSKLGQLAHKLITSYPLAITSCS